MDKPSKEQIRKTIGKNIRRERLSRNISVDEFSDMMGLTPGFIGLIERGQRGTTSSCMYRISKVLCVSIDVLFEDRECDENELLEFNKENAFREKIASIIFDFSQEELAYAANMLLSLRNLRGLRAIDDEDSKNMA